MMQTLLILLVLFAIAFVLLYRYEPFSFCIQPKELLQKVKELLVKDPTPLVYLVDTINQTLQHQWHVDQSMLRIVPEPVQVDLGSLTLTNASVDFNNCIVLLQGSGHLVLPYVKFVGSLLTNVKLPCRFDILVTPTKHDNSKSYLSVNLTDIQIQSVGYLSQLLSLRSPFVRTVNDALTSLEVNFDVVEWCKRLCKGTKELGKECCVNQTLLN